MAQFYFFVKFQMLGFAPSESGFVCSDCSICNVEMMINDMKKRVGLSGGYWLLLLR